MRFRLRCVVLLMGFLAAMSSRASAGTEPGDARVVGHVICADTGQPARFATVILQPVPAPNDKLDPQRLPAPSSTIAGDDGAYLFDSVHAGRYVIGAELEGYVNPLVTASADRLKDEDPAAFSALFHRMTSIAVDPSSTASADIRLERGAALSGTVSYDDGSPSIQATLELLRRARDGATHEVALSSLEIAFPGIANIKTNDLGQYRVAGLPPGDYILRVSLPKPMAAFSGFTVNKLRADQTPENLARLRLYSGNAFRLRDARPVHVNGGEEIAGLDFIFPLSTLHQVSAVLSSAGGFPLKNVQVSLVYADNQEVLDTADVDNVTHTAFFRSVPQGSYLLQVKGPAGTGNGQAVISVPLQVNADLQNVPLTLP